MVLDLGLHPFEIGTGEPCKEAPEVWRKIGDWVGGIIQEKKVFEKKGVVICAQCGYKLSLITAEK